MRPGAFAAAVAGRYGAARGRISRSSLVLLGPRRPSPGHVHRHRSIRAVLNFRHLELGQRRSTVVHSTVHAAPLPARILTRTIPRTIVATRVEQRVGVPERGAVKGATTQGLVVRERRPLEQTQQTQAAQPATKPQLNRVTVQPKTVPAALPPLELARVTDHVLRSLDRQMSSWRERRGKS